MSSKSLAVLVIILGCTSLIGESAKSCKSYKDCSSEECEKKGKLRNCEQATKECGCKDCRYFGDCKCPKGKSPSCPDGTCLCLNCRHYADCPDVCQKIGKIRNCDNSTKLRECGCRDCKSNGECAACAAGKKLCLNGTCTCGECSAIKDCPKEKCHAKGKHPSCDKSNGTCGCADCTSDLGCTTMCNPTFGLCLNGTCNCRECFMAFFCPKDKCKKQGKEPACDKVTWTCYCTGCKSDKECADCAAGKKKLCLNGTCTCGVSTEAVQTTASNDKEKVVKKVPCKADKNEEKVVKEESIKPSTEGVSLLTNHVYVLLTKPHDPYMSYPIYEPNNMYEPEAESMYVPYRGYGPSPMYEPNLLYASHPRYGMHNRRKMYRLQTPIIYG